MDKDDIFSAVFKNDHASILSFLGGSVVKNPPASLGRPETQLQSLCWKDSLE